MRYQPKKWPAPKSRRTRENRAKRRTGMTDLDFSNEIIKTLWPGNYDRVRPVWAVQAHRFGWMTSADFYSIKPVMQRTKVSLMWESMFERFPLSNMIRRQA